MSERTSSRANHGVALCVLGPIEILHGEVSVPIGSAKQRLLLGVLLLHANQVLSAAALLDELWADDPPASASKMLQILVSRIRKKLDADDAAQIVTRAPGYCAQVAVEQLDCLHFEALARRGIDALKRDPAAAMSDLEDALGLWRGEPLSDVSCGPRAQAAIARLQERWLAVAEARIDAGFALGRHAELTSDLADLVRAHPFHERFAAQEMLALYRSGRQAEALDVFRRTRAALHDELGIEPGAELRALEVDILNQDVGQPHGTPPPEPSDARPLDLPSTSKAAAEPPRNPPARRRRLALTASAAVAAALAGAGLATFLPGSTPSRAAAQPRSVAIFDGSTARLVSDIRVGANPGALAADAGIAWVANRDDRTVSQLDIASGRIVRTVGIGRTPSSVSAQGNRVWIGDGFDGTLTRILVPDNEVSSPFYPGPQIGGLLAVLATPNDLWVGLADNQILRLDPASLQVKARITVPHRVFALAADNSALWSIDFNSDGVTRIDPTTMAITVTTLPSRPHAITTGGGGVWVTTAGDDRLWRIDPANGQVTGSTPLGIDPGALIFGAGAVWVSSTTTGVIDRIDPSTRELVRTLRLGHNIGGIVSSGNDLLVTVD